MVMQHVGGSTQMPPSECPTYPADLGTFVCDRFCGEIDCTLKTPSLMIPVQASIWDLDLVHFSPNSMALQHVGGNRQMPPSECPTYPADLGTFVCDVEL